MAVTYLIRFNVAPEKADDFLRLLNGVLDEMRLEQTFHEAVLHRDPQSDHHFLLYETWESHEEVMAVQLHRPYRRAYEAALPGLLLEPRDVTIWEPVREDRRAHGKEIG